jgi:bis(5'-nucleosyl)-tetraphosphatase (symmetrical)
MDLSILDLKFYAYLAQVFLIGKMVMSTYAIGDIQGCLQPLKKLLAHIDFNPEKDTLWFTGDLVNRGPDSLETLRFIKNLGSRHKVVLGNHDLHLIARHFETHPGSADDTLDDILSAPDRTELIQWLRTCPLIYHDSESEFTMVHAGLANSWDLNKALLLAAEVQSAIQSDDATLFFEHMYGDTPALWSEDLQGWDRLRCITNYFTRVRLCTADGSLNLHEKDHQAQGLTPWFNLRDRQTHNNKILFGHWAALNGETHNEQAIGLDTGCVWGNCLTAFCLETQKRLTVRCAAT